MSKEIKLPELGQTIEEGTIVNCLVKVGQNVKKGDLLFEIETDKAVFEMESPQQGFVKVILAQPNQTVSVGQTLLILGEENEKIGDVKKPEKKTIVKKPAPKKSADLSKLSRAEKMLLSKREKPCFYLNISVDMTELETIRKKMNESAEIKISINDFIIRALASGLAQWPVMTGRIEDDSIRLADSIDINFSIPAKSGLVNAVIKQVDKKNLTQIARETTALIEKAEIGKLSPEDLEEGCITLNNLGSLGIDSFIPIVEPGQCSIIGVGKINEKLILEKDNPAVRKIMKMTLAADHKIANGAEAAQFLSCVGKLLEDPQKLL
jgi:pyruvate dehydrogenase E2 component (dihydrolipoamide acetyltransferase)